MIPVQELVSLTGARGPNAAGFHVIKCPFHDDATASLNFSEKGFNCFGCGRTGHINELMKAFGMSTQDSFTNGSTNGPVGDWKSQLHLRGLRPETIEQFKIKPNHKGTHWRFACDNGAVRWKAMPGTDGSKARWETTGKIDHLYNLKRALKVGLGTRLFLVEGEPDCWIMDQAGLPAVSFTMGATTVPAEAVKKLADTRCDIDIIYDLDEPGRTGSIKAAKELRKAGLTVRLLKLPSSLPPASDVSNLYCELGKDDKAFRQAILELEELGEEATELDESELTHYDASDNDNSKRFVELHGAELRYVALMRKWFVYRETEQRWVYDVSDVRVEELATSVGEQLKIDACAEPDSKTAEKIFRQAIRALSRSGISGMVHLARGKEGIPFDHQKFDADPWLIGVRNGVVNLKTGELRKADPADYMSKQCPVVFDESADCPRFKQAMEEWFPDQDTRDYVQRVAGSALVGRQKDHQLIIHYGGGRNGKGTFVRALQNVLGEYARVIHLSLLTTQKGSQHDTVRADLWGARLAVATETEKNVSLAEANIKNLTGGDRITARRLYQDPWEFDPTFSIHLQTNYLPTINGRDTGIWSRIKVVPWVSTFEGTDQDTDLADKLAAEAPGILNWLIRGCLEWQDIGLKEPEAVIDATWAYREAEDVLARFEKDYGIVFGEGEQIPWKSWNELVKSFADSEGLKLRPLQSDIKEWLAENGCRESQPSSLNGARVWIGVGIKE